jgi:hypothetical protein
MPFIDRVAFCIPTLSLGFEATDEYFQSMSSLAEGLVIDIGECLRAQNVEHDIVAEWCELVSENFVIFGLAAREIFKAAAREGRDISNGYPCRGA